jgi:hypothetical protein
MQESFMGGIVDASRKVPALRGYFFEVVKSVQLRFLEIVERSSDKLTKLMSFMDSLNRLVEDKKGILSLAEAKEHLLDKLEHMHEDIWRGINDLKAETIEAKRKIEASQILESESDKLFELHSQFVQLELNQLSNLIVFLVTYKAARLQAPYE